MVIIKRGGRRARNRSLFITTMSKSILGNMVQLAMAVAKTAEGNICSVQP